MTHTKVCVFTNYPLSLLLICGKEAALGVAAVGLVSVVNTPSTGTAALAAAGLNVGLAKAGAKGEDTSKRATVLVAAAI